MVWAKKKLSQGLKKILSSKYFCQLGKVLGAER